MTDTKEREAFDTWWDREGTTLADWDGALLGWQARAALAAAQATVEPDLLGWLETEVTAISCRYHGDPSYDHDAYWMRDRVIKLIAEARDVFAAPVAAQASGSEQLPPVTPMLLANAAFCIEHWNEVAEVKRQSIIDQLLAASAQFPAKSAAPAELTLDASEKAYLAARLRRLFGHFKYKLPAFAASDEKLIGIAPVCIGAMLANLDAAPAAPVAQGLTDEVRGLLEEARNHVAYPAEGHDGGMLALDLINRIDAILARATPSAQGEQE